MPFLVAPGEAEAQCAQLELSGLASGTVTDDSDVWLFGGKKVYRNVFNRDKNPQHFSATEIWNVLGKLLCVPLKTPSILTDQQTDLDRRKSRGVRGGVRYFRPKNERKWVENRQNLHYLWERSM